MTTMQTFRIRPPMSSRAGGLAMLSGLRDCAWDGRRKGKAAERRSSWGASVAGTALFVLMAAPLGAQRGPATSAGNTARLEALMEQLDTGVQARAKLAQEIVDKIFSFHELGMQEFETRDYLTGLLRRHGFRVEEGIADIPTAWWATWGGGDPVVALGTDVDGFVRGSQKPGVAYHAPIVEGAPGHAEGHNAGQGLIIVAALALKEVMEREGIPGTLVVWPGIAEEQLAGKAWFVRNGYFDDVDAVLYAHVGGGLSTSWGENVGWGVIGAEFTFTGEERHAALAPEGEGRSALDAVELMNAGWNFWREHMSSDQRSFYVITEGGYQPNVIPARASVWYWVWEVDYPRVMANFERLVEVAEGAARMTQTRMEYRINGAAWPRHLNRPLAEVMQEQIEVVGLPTWSEEDQVLAMAVQLEVGVEPRGLSTRVGNLGSTPDRHQVGPTDDIGDVTWKAPTVQLSFPSNIPGLRRGHHWIQTIAMATPIAHKGAVAGAKVTARTALRFYLDPQLRAEVRDYFERVQRAREVYVSFLGPEDAPPIELNRDMQEEYRSRLGEFYYDETRFDKYLEQLGIEYPTLRPDQWERLRALGLVP